MQNNTKKVLRYGCILIAIVLAVDTYIASTIPVLCKTTLDGKSGDCPTGLEVFLQYTFLRHFIYGVVGACVLILIMWMYNKIYKK